MDALSAGRCPPLGKGDGGLTRRGAIGLMALAPAAAAVRLANAVGAQGQLT